jgi:MscS family membrane protein
MLEGIQQHIGNGFSLHLWNGLVAFLTVMVVGFLLKYALQTVGRKLISKTQNDLDDRIIDVIIPRLKWLVFVIGLYLALEQIAKGILAADKTGQELIRYLEGIVYVAFIALFTILLIRLIDTSLKYIIDRHAKEASALNDAVLPLLQRLVFLLIVFIAAVIALGHFGVDVSSLLVFLGGGSVAIALAAQETLANMIAGFVIMLDRPFRIGDRIKLPTGEVGDVYEIGLRSTKILDFDNNVIVGPNSELTKAKVINFSYPRAEIRILVEMSVAYGTSIERARTIMVDLARSNPDVLRQPPPEVVFSEIQKSSCTLQLNARTNDWKKKGRAEAALREQIYNCFLKDGINPEYPRRLVYVSEPGANVTTSNG